MATVADVITAALQRLGVLAATEVPTGDDQTLAFLRFNSLIDQWATERLLIYTITQTTATMTANQTSFSVGPGGDINIARPVFIDHINYINTSPTPAVEYPLAMLTDDDWSRVSLKTETASVPDAAYYNPTFTSARGTLYPWPIPQLTTLQWSIYASTAVPEFAATSDTVSLPPGYRRFLETNLAVELAPDFEIMPSPVLMRAASEAKAVLKASNLRINPMRLDSGALIGVGKGSGWSILVGP